MESALFPRSDEFIRSGAVRVVDIKAMVRAKTQRSAKVAKNHPELLPHFSFDLSTAHRNRYSEDSTAANQSFDLLEACLRDQLIELALRSPSHDPGIAFAIGQYSGDHCNLRMPRLAGVDKI